MTSYVKLVTAEPSSKYQINHTDLPHMRRGSGGMIQNVYT